MSTPSAWATPRPAARSAALHADEDRGCGAADGGVLAGAGGGVDRGGEHVVALLVGAAGFAELGDAGALLVGHEPAARTRREVRVEESGELRGDLGHELAGDGDESVACPAEAEPAAAHRPSSSGSRPSWSRNVDHACACTRNSSAVHRTGAPSPRPVASATSACSAVANDGRVGDRAGAVEFADDRARGIACPTRPRRARRDVREHRLDRLTGEARARPGGRPERDAPTRLERRDLRHPLDELDRRAAPHAGREALIAELDRERSATSPAHAARCASTTRPSASSAPRLASNSSSDHPDASSNPSTPGERRAELLERVAGAGHGSILAAPTDIRTDAKQLISLCIESASRPLWRTSRCADAAWHPLTRVS